MLINLYNRPDKIFVSGKGMNIYDEEGNEYLDVVSGIAVNLLGHCHPEIVKTIKNQSEKLLHISNLYHTKEQFELAEKLVSLSDHSKVFFCNSSKSGQSPVCITGFLQLLDVPFHEQRSI